MRRLTAFVWFVGFALLPAPAQDAAPVSFAVTVDPAVLREPFTGRVFVTFTPNEPRPVLRSLNWFNPQQSGHGFQLEKVNDTTVTAFWFTFDNAGNQVWILGVGTIADNRIEMQAVKSSGGRFPPNFNPAQIVNNPWGTMTFTFTGCNAGQMQWTSTDPAFTASGTLALERVTTVQGTTCP